jgi:hypothetical protein
MFKPTVLGSLLLAGCASAADIYSAGVDETAVIEKPFAEVSRCMSLRMGAAPITEPDGKATFLIGNGYQTIGMFTLSAVPEGTLVEIRRRSSTVSTGMWRDCR